MQQSEQRKFQFVACYERRRHRSPSHQHREAHRVSNSGEKRSMNKAMIIRSSQSHNQLLKGLVTTEFERCLNRSLVYTADEPRDLATLSSSIINGFGQCTKICALSGFKFILTFPTVEQMEETWRNHEELDLWLSEIKKNLGKSSLSKQTNILYNSYESMKILIVTNVSERIEEDLFLNFHQRSRSTLPLIQTEHSSPWSPAMENNTSNNEVPGFKDLDIEMTYENEVAQSHLRNNLVNDDLSDVHLDPLGITIESEEQPLPSFENRGIFQNNDLDSYTTPKALENLN
ncbi:hypothetical protein Cgig2_017661 [Carnegiea gigantea]|uniref:Uncharacterized protein n=1 Tax=Carnegiea gigantea TaxID=171969 RepID=A0A9Q1QFH0_9CARY|nr:hypothetical protein Cgig2_017661 [Carnegiea gigantea]